MLFRYCQAETAGLAIVLPAQDGKPFVPASRCIFENPPVCRRIEQAFFFSKSV
jgi:hypothetical protein